MSADDGRGEFVPDARYNTPLAPAPTPGGLWAALCQCGCIGGTFSAMVQTYWRGETGRFTFLRNPDGSIDAAFYPENMRIDANNHEAHMSDMQKYCAQLAYCAQPGWEALHAADLSAPTITNGGK